MATATKTTTGPSLDLTPENKMLRQTGNGRRMTAARRACRGNRPFVSIRPVLPPAPPSAQASSP